VFSFLTAVKVSLALLAAVGSVPVASRADFFGVSSTTMLYEEEEAAELELLGIHTVRMNVEWGQVDRVGPCEGPGTIEWSHYDGIFRSAAEHHLRVLADLYGNLGSCPSANAFPVPGSGNFTEYTSGFIPEVVRRYGSGGSFWTENPSLPYDPITTWEVWNEPNLPANDSAGVIDPQAYAQLLIATSSAIRSVDPAASVLIGGIAFDGAPRSSLQSIGGYLGSIYEQPVGYTAEEFDNAFDGVGIHPYAVSGRGSTFEFGGPAVSEERVEEARSVLDALGGGGPAGKSMYVTELGWPSEFAPAAEITPAVQARYLTETMAWLYQHAADYDISYAAAFTSRDYRPREGCSEPECWPQYSGLKRLEFLPSKAPPGGPTEAEYKVDRPARCAYKALVSGIGCFQWTAEELGGPVGGAPAVATEGAGRLEVFARGADGRVDARAFGPGGEWGAWAPLPGPATASGPAAVSWGPDRMDVVARLPDGSVEHWGREGEGAGWGDENLGGLTTGEPAIASWAPGRLDVFVRGSDGTLDHSAWEATSGWSAWEHLPGPPITSSPAAVAWSTGRLDVVAALADGSVEHWAYQEGQWVTENLGGSAASAPAIASGSPNRLTVFVRGTDGELEQQTWDPIGRWSGWSKVPGVSVASGPTAVAWNPNRLDVVALDESGAVVDWHWEG
jgi:hypothetical protein